MGRRERIAGHIAVGYLTSETVVGPEARYRVPAGGDIQLHADGELCVELGRDLDARPDRDATIAAVACCWPAVEIVDLAPLPGEPESVVAANVFHRGVLFGDTPVPISATTSVTGSVNGTSRERAAWPDDIPRASPPRRRSSPRSASAYVPVIGSSPDRSSKCQSRSEHGRGLISATAPRSRSI
jgi:hypothetical protein